MMIGIITIPTFIAFVCFIQRYIEMLPEPYRFLSGFKSFIGPIKLLGFAINHLVPAIYNAALNDL